MYFEPSELIINPDGSIFHLRLKPEDIADTILLVGDPGRVELIGSFLDGIEFKKENREFVSITGSYKGKRITALSTGIGTDNIDIVVNELDALANIDLKTRKQKDKLRSLNFIRIGTSGSLQRDVPVDSFLLSLKSIGFDGLLNFYEKREKISDLGFEEAFKQHVDWDSNLTNPYVTAASSGLIEKLNGPEMHEGITISAPGFYGPQGRQLRIKAAMPDLNDKITDFEYKGQKITNYEMESSAIYGLSKHLGHHAATVCAIIANRVNKEYLKEYKRIIKHLIQIVLQRI